MSDPKPAAPLSPCTGVCRIGDDGFCHGCARSLQEIAGWSQIDQRTRWRIMTEELPRRRANRTAKS